MELYNKKAKLATKGSKRSKKIITNKRRRNSKRRPSKSINTKRRISRSQKGGQYTPEEINNTAQKVHATFSNIDEIMDKWGFLLAESDAKDTQLEFKMKNAYMLYFIQNMKRPNLDELITTFNKHNI